MYIIKAKGTNYLMKGGDTPNVSNHKMRC